MSETVNDVVADPPSVAERERYAPLTLLVSVAFAPGIVAHEYAHVAACRCFGVEVRSVRPLNLLASHAEIVHERVDSFVADLAIGFAPLAVNSALGLACLLLAARLRGTLDAGAVLVGWAGVTCTVTAFPTRYDTETLWRTGRAVDGVARVVSVPVAAILRAVTAVPYVAGVYGFLWTTVLVGWATTAPPG